MTTPVTRTLLFGTLDDTNPLSRFRGNALVLSKILLEVYDFNEHHIDRASQAWQEVVTPSWLPDNTFPEPTGVCINMMPISLPDMYADTLLLPAYLKQYIPMIKRCRILTEDVYLNNTVHNVIGYLTVCEEQVPVGVSQRRSGLHIECPGLIRYGGRIITRESGDPLFCRLKWGLGNVDCSGMPIDGIYMASSVSNSCRIFPVLIKEPESVTDKHGGIEHMRDHLGPGRCLAANELVWFSDRTPHESLPVVAVTASGAEDPSATFVYRQFFRLVVGRISVWYAKHNTANPNGIQPDAPISDDDRFAG